MIMHGTWYKGPQLAHPHSHTEYHQFRSYPSFVVTPYHESSSPASLINSTAPSAPSAPIFVEGSFTSVNASSNNLTVLSPTIKIEQNYSEPLTGVEDYALNGLDCSGADNGTFKKPTSYVWPNTSSEVETNNNSITDNTHITNPATPPTPPPDTHVNLQQSQKAYSNSLKPIEDTELIEIPPATQQEQQQQQNLPHQQQDTQSHKSIKHKHPTTTTTSSSSSSSLAEHHLGNGSTMPIGGVQGQNPTQGLVHWMSAVMAEHMTGQSHHDPSGVGMHYMWNGNVDQYGQHNKEIADHNFWPPTPPTMALRNHNNTTNSKQGYEAKMNEHHNNLQKGHFIEDNRLEHHAVTPQGGSVLGSSGGGHHGNHIGHHGSASAAALLVVPQPINATKIGSSLGGSGAGTGRKYQCKMCPQKIGPT